MVKLRVVIGESGRRRRRRCRPSGKLERVTARDLQAIRGMQGSTRKGGRKEGRKERIGKELP